MTRATAEKGKTDNKVKSSTLKINDVTVNVQSCFYPEKELSEILYLIANTKLREKSA